MRHTNSCRSAWMAFVAVATLLLTWSGPAAAYEYLNPNQCPSGSNWASTPVSYQINNAGSADMSFSQLETTIQQSFTEWGAPCCSTFSATYSGSTSQTAWGTRNSSTADPVLSWIENSNNWPSALGNPSGVLGVTLATFTNNCKINNAPIVFNGISYQYAPAGSVDLESIAVHEIGHLLGLGHTQVQGATMYPSYLGGTQQASIENDDINGVCSLYGTSCGCTQDTDCRDGYICNSQGTCEEAPCMSDAECPVGKSCNLQSGDCEETTCTGDSDCPRGFTCANDGTCDRICNLCKSCNTHSDCGSQNDGWFCQSGLCIKACEDFLTCPGDSKCETITFRTSDGTQQVDLCLNPGACTDDPRTWCPETYACGAGNTGSQPCLPPGNEDTGVSEDVGPDVGPDVGTEPDTSTSEDTGLPPDSGMPGPDACTGPNCQPVDVGGEDTALQPALRRETASENACLCRSGPDGVPAGPAALVLVWLAGLFVRRRSE